jgi:outer membrane protein OmpA-like peptidoglycan-associated protein
MKFKYLVVIFVLFVTINDVFSQKILDSWGIGANLGLNYNLNSLGYQDLSPSGFDFVPMVYFDGSGVGPYGSIFYEYKSGSWWGTELRLSYDDRSGKVEDKKGDITSQFDLSLSYLNIEPIIKYYYPPDNKLSFYGGFQFLFALQTESSYNPNINEIYSTNKSQISGMNSFVFGLTAGTSYDFILKTYADKSNLIIAPFAELSWIFNQREATYQNTGQNSINDIWSTTTIRLGAKIAYDFPNYSKETILVNETNEEKKDFEVSQGSGGNFKIRRVEEYFPIIPHVFFDRNSDEIPARYNLINNEIAKIFDEKTFLDKSNTKINNKEYHFDQFKAYYNILNIYADRMKKNPNVSLMLIGSDPFTNKGKEIAEKIKTYLVEVFNIKPGLISTEGRNLPRNPSASQNASAADKARLDAENKRVEFIFNDIVLYEPIKLDYISESQLDNDLEFIIDDAAGVKNWSVSFNNLQRTQAFGPFEDNYIRIDPSKIMRGINESDFNVQVNFFNKDKSSFSQSKDINLKKVMMPDDKRVVKYSLLFNYGSNSNVDDYYQMINKMINPNIRNDKTVFIHSHTDDIGEEKNNTKMSMNRSSAIKSLINTMIPNSKAQIIPLGFGEYYMHSYFDNSTPEGRFYNRNAVIEILPKIFDEKIEK